MLKDALESVMEGISGRRTNSHLAKHLHKGQDIAIREQGACGKQVIRHDFSEEGERELKVKKPQRMTSLTEEFIPRAVGAIRRL